MSLRRTTLAILLGVAMLATVGCGRGGDQQTVGTVTERFLAAVDTGRGPAACAQLSGPAIAQLEKEMSKRCPQAVTGVMVKPSPVARAQVYITSAKVDLADGESAFLDRTPAGWRLSAVGCKPMGAKPADRPYDCELEG